MTLLRCYLWKRCRAEATAPSRGVPGSGDGLAGWAIHIYGWCCGISVTQEIRPSPLRTNLPERLAINEEITQEVRSSLLLLLQSPLLLQSFSPLLTDVSPCGCPLLLWNLKLVLSTSAAAAPSLPAPCADTAIIPPLIVVVFDFWKKKNRMNLCRDKKKKNKKQKSLSLENWNETLVDRQTLEEHEPSLSPVSHARKHGSWVCREIWVSS